MPLVSVEDRVLPSSRKLSTLMSVAAVGAVFVGLPQQYPTPCRRGQRTESDAVVVPGVVTRVMAVPPEHEFFQHKEQQHATQQEETDTVGSCRSTNRRHGLDGLGQQPGQAAPNKAPVA